jgi:hypothetical protein
MRYASVGHHADITRACGARPSRGVSQGEMTLRGKAGDGTKGVFLGGTRSARPRCTALCTPRHFYFHPMP